MAARPCAPLLSSDQTGTKNAMAIQKTMRPQSVNSLNLEVQISGESIIAVLEWMVKEERQFETFRILWRLVSRSAQSH